MGCVPIPRLLVRKLDGGSLLGIQAGSSFHSVPNPSPYICLPSENRDWRLPELSDRERIMSACGKKATKSLKDDQYNGRSLKRKGLTCGKERLLMEDDLPYTPNPLSCSLAPLYLRA